MKFSAPIIAAAVLTGGLLTATSASAALIIDDTWAVSGANDCSGIFGQGFNNCKIDDSPIIGKWDRETDSWEVNSAFNSITGDEFTITLPTDSTNGSWTYAPGTDDPAVRFWVAKGGNSGFNLFFEVDSGDELTCLANPASCYSLALAVTSGEYWLPINSNNGKPAGLSHLSFYDTGEGTTPPAGVPEPSLVALFGFGLVGMSLSHIRRKNKTS